MPQRGRHGSSVCPSPLASARTNEIIVIATVICIFIRALIVHRIFVCVLTCAFVIVLNLERLSAFERLLSIAPSGNETLLSTYGAISSIIGIIIIVIDVIVLGAIIIAIVIVIVLAVMLFLMVLLQLLLLLLFLLLPLPPSLSPSSASSSAGHHQQPCLSQGLLDWATLLLRFRCARPNGFRSVVRIFLRFNLARCF